MSAGRLDVLSLEAAADPSFAADWDALVAAHGDVYYRRDYLAVAQRNEPGPVLLALFRGAAGAVLYPVVRRPLDALAVPSELTQGRCDLATPYEYGGPLLAAGDAEKAAVRAAFDRAFAAWCGSHGVVSEFVRFHPLLAVQGEWTGGYAVRISGQNVVLDLSLTDDALLAGMRGTTRRAILTAARRGLRLRRVGPGDAARFGALYRGNMDRLAARPEYYFADDYFRRLAALEAQALLLAAEDADGGLAGVAAFLVGPHHAHYHLSAADRAMSRLNPLNALIFEAARLLRARGCRLLHLGGVAAGQVGLRAFKDGFSSERRAYAIGTRIRDADAYRTLSAAARAVSGTFFPAYRATRLAA
jgi:serine/alanine adding enzyme